LAFLTAALRQDEAQTADLRDKLNVQEAMLCKTPVVGSGSGGMRELLKGGGQLVCEDFSDLPGKVQFAILHQDFGERGYRFAKTLTQNRFRQDWTKAINST